MAFTNQWVDENAGGATPVTRSRFATFYLSSGQFKKALPILRQSYEASPSTVDCAVAWLVADLVDDKATRDEYFKFMETRHKGSLRIQRPSGGSL